jgi:lysophospholipase L1-like esterase
MMLIVCHGDSLTQAADVEARGAWPARIAAALGATVINSGVAGDTSAGLLSRFYPDVVRHRPDAVILLGGTNDLWWHLDIGQIQANLFAMACQARFHGIVPVIGLPPPLHAALARNTDMFAPAAGWDECSRALSSLAAALRASSQACSIDCLDLHSPFLDPDGQPRTELYLENGLHPSEEGHRLMAEAAVGVISRLPPIPGR